MLSNTLNTNEVKDSSGAEVEFSRISTNNRDTEFKAVLETPARRHRLKISHLETGSGVNVRRRSRVGIYKEVDGSASSTVAAVNCYVVLDAPVGNLATYAEAKNAVAELMSFLASLGASTTILYDCTGNGANALVNGDL